jgi:hypothetical protein
MLAANLKSLQLFVRKADAAAAVDEAEVVTEPAPRKNLLLSRKEG